MLTNHVNESESTSTPTIISHIIEMPHATKKQYFLVWALILLFYHILAYFGCIITCFMEK